MGKKSTRAFLGYFFSAYGFLWFIPAFASFVSSTHINTGEFGYYGFPIIALSYAIVRVSVEKNMQPSTSDMQETLERIDADVSNIRRIVERKDSPNEPGNHEEA